MLITQATHGHTAMVRLLLARGVKPDAEFGGGHALLAAAKVGDPELVRALLAAGVPAGVAAPAR